MDEVGACPAVDDDPGTSAFARGAYESRVEGDQLGPAFSHEVVGVAPAPVVVVLLVVLGTLLEARGEEVVLSLSAFQGAERGC